jgi:hypothetical protein
MNAPLLPRIGAGCGAVFSVVLVVAVGDGTSFNPVRAVAAISAITLVLPFLGYLCSVLRRAEGPDGWLANTALAAGISGTTLKLASVAPELAMHRIHVADGTTLHSALDDMAGAATVLALYPLAIFAAATAIVSLHTGALPRWLGIGAVVTAVALAVNGAFLGTDFVPALLVFALWTLLASVHLVRAAGAAQRVAPVAVTATA